ncbi:MAG: hypothetical protein WCF19_07900 [Chlamydiales bacterium]
MTNIPDGFQNRIPPGIPRELKEEIDLASGMVVPRNLKTANGRNGVERIHAAPTKDPYKNYFNKATVQRKPSAGSTHMAALPVFRKRAMTGSSPQPPLKRPRTR